MQVLSKDKIIDKQSYFTHQHPVLSPQTINFYPKNIELLSVPKQGSLQRYNCQIYICFLFPAPKTNQGQ